MDVGYAMVERITIGLYLLTVALWLGSAFFMAFVIAPKTFQFFPSRAKAGSLVSNFLKSFDILKIFLILGLVSFSLVRGSESPLPSPSLPEVAVIFLLAASWASHHFLVAPRLDDCGLAIGGFDGAPADAPERAVFARLHSMAMFLTLGDFAAGLFLLFYAILRLP